MNTPSTTDILRRKFWDQAPDHALILLDTDWKIVSWAGAAPDIFGYDEAEVLGKTLEFLFTEEDQQERIPEHERAVSLSAGRSDDDRWHVRKDGAKIWVNGSMAALRDSTTVVGFSKVVIDRTNQRTLIETLQNRLEAAQHEVANRTVFFGRLAHEVRNCLQPINSVVHLLSQTEGTIDRKLPLAVISRQVVQLERMMKDLTEVARFGAGKLA